MSKLTTIHHIAVKCDHPPTAILDLRELDLEFEVLEEHNDWAFLKFANLFVALVRPGHEHLGIVVDPSSFFQHLRELGGTARTHRDGSVGFYTYTRSDVGVEFLDRFCLPDHLELSTLPLSVNQ